MIEDIIRDTLRVYSYTVSEECIQEIAFRVENHLDNVGWVATE